MNLRFPPTKDPMLLVGLKTVEINDARDPDEIFIHAESTVTPPARCNECDGERPQRWGKKEGYFRDVRYAGKIATVVASRQRWQCTACLATWIEAIPSLHSGRMMTRRLEADIALACHSQTNMDVARFYVIDEGTVRNIFLEYLDEKEKTVRFETPRVLGIDEVHMSEVHCVLTNVGERSLFDILESRAKDKLGPYLEALPDPHKVETIVADMWKPYHDLAARIFPGRLMVVDKFHVVRMANNGLDEVRKMIARKRSPEERILLKDERHLLHHRKRDLSPREWDRVNAWLKAFPILKKAYDAKERFAAAYDAPDRRTAEREIDRCLQSIPIDIDEQFLELTRAVSNWKVPILNYFDDPATNAYTEAVNGLIRAVDRRGRGYAFRVMRGRLLYDPVARTKTTSTRYKRHKQRDDVIGFAGGLDVFDDVGVTVEYGPDLATLVAALEKEAPDAHG